MKIAVIKSANQVNIGPLRINNEKLAKFMITLNDAKNNLKKRRRTHWVKVSFEGMGSIELGNELMCMGDYDEYPISPDTKVLIPIEDMEQTHKQYVCSTLNTAILLQNKTLTEDEEIIIVYTEIADKSDGKAVDQLLLNGMKKCLFEYQMKAYSDYAEEGMDRQLFDKRVQQILAILPDLEKLMEGLGSEPMLPEPEIRHEEMRWDSNDEEDSMSTPEEIQLMGERPNDVTYEAAEISEDVHFEPMEMPDKSSSREEEAVDEDATEVLEPIVPENEAQNEVENETQDETGKVKWVKLDLSGKNNNK